MSLLRHIRNYGRDHAIFDKLTLTGDNTLPIVVVFIPDLSRSQARGATPTEPVSRRYALLQSPNTNHKIHAKKTHKLRPPHR